MSKFNACARMSVLIEVDVTSTWGGATTVEQVHKQAEESARNKLREVKGLRIIGEPSIKMITHETEF